MSTKLRKDKQISRRGVLPILGSAFLLPFLGFGRSTPDSITDSSNEEY